jgi:hypothetical protein
MIYDCIRAKKADYPPTSLLEKISKDASTFYLGMQKFKWWNKRKRKELEAKSNVSIDKEQWRLSTIRLLESHRYYTDLCQKKLKERKQKNLTKVLKQANSETEQVLLELGQKSKPKIERPDKGIETMFRITSTKSQGLSDQADNKAHILITVNSIIISVLLGTVVRSSANHSNFMVPSILMTTVSLVVIAFAILSTTPHVPCGTFTQQEIDDKKVNLLFFGNFYRMHLDEYSNGMLQMMEDRNFLYLSLIRDVYGQGVVLGRKYRLLKLAYYIFLIGLVVSVISFFIASR